MTHSFAVVNSALRDEVNTKLGFDSNPSLTKISNGSFYTVHTDMNGVERPVEIKVIVHGVEDGKTAQEQITELAAKRAEADYRASVIHGAAKAKREAADAKREEREERRRAKREG